MTESGPLVLPSGIALSRFLAELTWKGFVISIVIAIVGAVHLVRIGFSVRDLVLLLGASASVVGFYGYGFVIMRKTTKNRYKRGFGPWLLALGGFIPYIFGSYLVFCEGLWGLWRLLHQFTYGSLFAALAFLVVGHQIVLAIYRISELGQAIEDGRVIALPPKT